MKTQLQHIHGNWRVAAGILMITMLMLAFRDAAGQTSTPGLEIPYAINAGGRVQTGSGGGGWSLFSSIGQPLAADPMNSTSGDITWVGFPAIFPIGVPAGISEEQTFGNAGRDRITGVTPNPFTDQGRIIFTLSQAGVVRLIVFDMLGRQRAVLVNGPREAGTITVTWHPESLDAGAYLVRLNVDGRERSSATVQYFK